MLTQDYSNLKVSLYKGLFFERVHGAIILIRVFMSYVMFVFVCVCLLYLLNSVDEGLKVASL